MPRATSLAAEIKQKTGIEPTLKKGGNGVFDVVVDGRTLFSKHAVGRFPTHEEVLGPLLARPG
ncbi:MAG: Rdx family protein [Myxococcales bacterium]|nr:Rdx family protein [Myxococcales bacterium]